ncbi:MAG: hypothetical protein FIA94_03225 [Nitrospirae bacterium]|nr:hypothetical protein [Nitrospirota bacterium]
MSENGWDIFKIGSLAGLMSFAWLVVKDVRNEWRRPRLRADFNKNLDLRIYNFTDTGWERKVATLHVRNKRPTTAIRSVATLRFVERPNGTEHLESNYALHWAGIDYTAQTTGAEPVDIGPETRRLDVVFTDKNQNIPGSWLAIPFALSGRLNRNQAYLPPGKYKVKIEISCENGKRNVKTLWITSPEQWQDLEVTLT